MAGNGFSTVLARFPFGRPTRPGVGTVILFRGNRLSVVHSGIAGSHAAHAGLLLLPSQRGAPRGDRRRRRAAAQRACCDTACSTAVGGDRRPQGAAHTCQGVCGGGYFLKWLSATPDLPIRWATLCTSRGRACRQGCAGGAAPVAVLLGPLLLVRLLGPLLVVVPSRMMM